MLLLFLAELITIIRKITESVNSLQEIIFILSGNVFNCQYEPVRNPHTKPYNRPFRKAGVLMRRKSMNPFIRLIFRFLTGGFAYGGIEIITRGFSHISMFVAGGLCFVFIGLLNDFLGEKMSFLSLMFLSALIITAVEFITGIIVNVWLKLDVWDYSYLPYNLKGQICLLFTNLWFLLSAPALLLGDWMRVKIMKRKPVRYRIF